MTTALPAPLTTVSLPPIRQAGFTLIEMMIAITIGLGILAGLVGVLATSSSNSRSNDQTTELMSTGRYALNALKQELRQAGFRGYTWAEPTPPNSLGTLSNECLESGAAAGTFISNIRQGVWGANNTNPFSGSCIPSNRYPNLSNLDDVLVVRRLATPPATPAPPVANTIYFQSSYAVGQVFRGTSVPIFPGVTTPLATFSVQTYVYYISPFTSSATESPLVPALFRVALLADGSMGPELVASGIEHLQVQYARTTTATTTQYLNADAITGSSSTSTATPWDDVNSVRIWLLARNTVAEPGYLNNNSYTMGDQIYDYSAAPDGFRRQVFSTVVQLRN